MKYSRYIISGVVALVWTMASTTPLAQAQNVVDVINNSGQHTIFAELLVKTQMDELLSKEGPFTVLAPTDAAFKSMGAEFEEIRKNADQLQNLVIGHLYNDVMPASEIEKAKNVSITKGDIKATNGSVHIIDKVLVE